ncbi:MAG TPA: hemophore-related protein [Blastococcus sp.]|nr:hemophore-related protein [Blastococcus sp.]
MRIRRSVLAAGSGLAVLLAVGVPAVAYAESGSGSGASTSTSSSTSASCPVQDLRKARASYLAAHQDVAAEVKKIRALPADQRAAARKAYLAQHPDVATDLKALRGTATGDWADALASAGGFLAAHPDVAGLLTQLENAPAAQRHQLAQDYLTAHPGTQAELRGALTTLRGHARACRTGGK